MKSIKVVIAILLLSGSAISSVAWADRFGHGGGYGHRGGHGHLGIGVVIGSAWGWPYYPPNYYYPNYYPAYPGNVIIQSPPIYVEQGAVPAPPAQVAENYWYFCNSPQGYYPYIKECPAGWQKVVPHPAQ